MSCLQPRINIIQVLLENFTACRPQFSHHFIPPLLLLPPSHSRTSCTDGTELLSSEPADCLQDLCLPAPHSRLAVNQLCLYRNLKWLHPLSSLWQKGLSGNKQNQNKTWLKIHIDDDPHQTHRKPHLEDEMLWANKKCCNTPVSVQEGSRGVSKSDQQGKKKEMSCTLDLHCATAVFPRVYGFRAMLSLLLFVFWFSHLAFHLPSTLKCQRICSVKTN